MKGANMRVTVWAVAVVFLCGAAGARADVWDVGTDNDNSFTSDNELVSGLDQVHDMAAQQGGTVEDEDWYPFHQFCNNSYEILLDGVTGGVGNVNTGSPALDLIDSDGTTVLYGSLPVSSQGIARRLGVNCVGSDAETTRYVRVSHPACGLLCSSTDQYHIHFRDTTALVPRFNNTATQVSILILQSSSPTGGSVSGLAYDSLGAVIGGFGIPLPANAVAVIDLSTTNSGSLAGKSGALKLVNTLPYGTLAGKVVAVEPATGFTFDTPLVYKLPEE
jgi:hypothetical protein